VKFARKQHPTVYNRVDLCVTIHKPILLGGLVLFNDKNKNYEKIRKNTNAPLKFQIRIRIFLSWTPPTYLSITYNKWFDSTTRTIDIKFPLNCDQRGLGIWYTDF